MEGLKQQILMGLPPLWRSIRCDVSLPPQASVQCATSDGLRKVAFLLVKGPIQSAMPFFQANDDLRSLGFETVWFFCGNGIPSTKHMLCAALSKSDSDFQVSILNKQGTSAQHRDQVGISELARAAADQRLKSVGFAAGQLVDVTFIADEHSCPRCGAIMHEVQHATFYQNGEPHSPGLALTKAKLGRTVAKLISEAVGSQSTSSVGLCRECSSMTTSQSGRKFQVTKSVGDVQLSSLAALELIRFQTTAWYIS